MGAIFGAIGRVSAAELREMGARLAHRGPVAGWDEVAPHVFLGWVALHEGRVHTRDAWSAVIDLSRAATQGVTEDEVFDTFLKNGISGLQSLSGAVAIAAWNDQTQTLVLARDFVGQKPLHYCALPGGGAAFATEYKALLAIDAVPATVDLDALQYLQCYKTTPPHRTLLQGVLSAPPGAVTHLTADGQLKSTEEMRPLRVNVRPVSETQARDELARRMVSAIRRVTTGRSRIGISLSGGIDSMSVAFACRDCAPQAELAGFTAGYGEDDPEIRTAALVMERLGGRHVPVIVTAEPLADLLPEAVWHFESPVGRTETVQALVTARAARADGFDCLMTGMGSDGLFAGMPKHKLLWLSQLLPPLRKDLQEFYALTQSGRAPQRPLAKLMNMLYFRGAIPPVPRIRAASFVPELPYFPAAGPEFLNYTMVKDAHETLSRSLVRLERPFQASGVDFSSPFFDLDVMDYAFALPSRLKIRRGQEKYILRQAMQSLVSPDLLNIPKGISRIRQDTEFAATLQKLSDRYLSAARLQARGWFDPVEVQGISRRLGQQRYHAEAAMRLWTIIVSEIWAQLYLDQRGRRPETDSSPAR
jgi:asparagine synthase (glutamine-hydrolysing)